ncbi:MAG: hypothetical protein P4M11_12940 [Candidatus Pacebacteria bacterium]|nr:hypothetical protein [Candidatus Paceibacterota bacterium]
MEYEDLLIYLKAFTRETHLDEDFLIEKARSFKVTQNMLLDLERLYNSGVAPRVRLVQDEKTLKRKIVSAMPDALIIAAEKAGENAVKAKL